MVHGVLQGILLPARENEPTPPIRLILKMYEVKNKTNSLLLHIVGWYRLS
jgi:hypothetical protein